MARRYEENQERLSLPSRQGSTRCCWEPEVTGEELLVAGLRQWVLEAPTRVLGAANNHSAFSGGTGDSGPTSGAGFVFGMN